MKFAAIDIGSNALRLLFANVYEGQDEANFKKADLVRIPLRLGEDAFLYRKISDEKIQKLITAMKAYRQLLDFYEVSSYKACATSAMREASNSKEIIELIRKEANINVEIIDGKVEAQIIYSTHVAEHMDSGNNYLYIDVGGGSTELTVFSKGKITASKSFNIGTIRMLNNLVTKELWSEMKEWVAKKTPELQPLVAIGSGGNINKIFKMSRKKQNRPLTYAKLKELHDFLDSYSLKDRIELLGLNPDRADVIVPAGKIFLTVMKSAAIERLYVPQIGMADGLIHLLYENHIKSGKQQLVFNE